MTVSLRNHVKSVMVSDASRRMRLSALMRASGDDLVVLMHGLGCAKESFAGAFEVAALDGFSMCAFDFPGHGGSAPVDRSAYSLQTYADAINLLIDKIKPRRVFMIGHSMGGAAGLIATQERDDVACFVSVEGNLVGDDCGLVSRTTADASLETFVTSGFGRFISELRASSRKDAEAWAGWYSRCDPVAIHQISRSLVEWSDSGKLFEFFKAMRRSCYVYGAEGGRLVHLLPLLVDASVYSICGSGHFPMVDNSADFYATITRIVLEGRAQEE